MTDAPPPDAHEPPVQHRIFGDEFGSPAVNALHIPAFERVYRLAAEYHVDPTRENQVPVRIVDAAGVGNERCIYCGRGKPQVKFKTKRHLLPQSLGNRSLLNLLECDECNGTFGRGADQDLVGHMKISALLTSTRLRRQTTAHRPFDASSIRRTVEEGEIPLIIKITEGSRGVGLRHLRGSWWEVITKQPPYSPFQSMRALARIGMALLMQDGQLEQAEAVGAWLFNESHAALPTQYLQASKPGYPHGHLWVRVWSLQQQLLGYPAVIVLVGVGLFALAWQGPTLAGTSARKLVLPTPGELDFRPNPATIIGYEIVLPDRLLSSYSRQEFRLDEVEVSDRLLREHGPVIGDVPDWLPERRHLSV